VVAGSSEGLGVALAMNANVAEASDCDNFGVAAGCCDSRTSSNVFKYRTRVATNWLAVGL